MPLPIIQRELRLAARKASTFYLRTVAAGVAVLIGSGGLMIQYFAGGGFGVGKYLFAILTALALAGVLLAGLFLTADSLSEEKREGTLGLLFLTDQRGYDVVLGKLVATSLRGFVALLSVFPILALTVLAGGVEVPQVWRTSLALLNTLFCSLAAGLFVSSVSRNHLAALGGTLVGLILLVGAGPAIDAVLAIALSAPFPLRAGFTSPLYAFQLATGWGKVPYWESLLISHGVGWLLLGAASLVVPRSWQDKPRVMRGANRVPPPVAAASATGSSSPTAEAVPAKTPGRGRARRIRKWLEINPAFWLAARTPAQAASAWILAGILLCTFLGFRFLGTPESSWIALAVAFGILTPVLYIWMAIRTCGYFVEARKSGLFELLMVTPLGPARIAYGYWRCFLQAFGPPLVLLFALQVVGSIVSTNPFRSMNLGSSAPSGTSLWVMAFFTAAGSVLTTVTNLVALVWFGMWMGLTSKNIGVAAMKTLALVLVVPWFAVTFLSGLAVPLWMLAVGRLGGTAGMAQGMLWFSVVSAMLSALLYVAKNVGFVAWSHRQLTGRFRAEVASGPVALRRLTSRVPPVMGATPPALRGSS